MANQRTEQVKLAADRNDFTRLSTLREASTMPAMRLLTANLYQKQELHLPLTQAEFDDNFPCEKKVFQIQEPGAGVVSNVGNNATVESAFLLTGVGVLVSVTGNGFAQPGVMYDTPADPATETPCNTGCETTASSRNAVLAWGYPTWEAIENFLAAYRVQMYIGRKYQVFDEAAMDLGLVTTLSEFIGASDSLVSTMPYIRETNDVLTAKEIHKQFIPQNVVVTTDGSECIGAPTAGVTWGAPRILGVMQKFYKTNQPILYTPGMQLDFRFVQESGDDCFRAAIARATILDPANATKPSASFAEGLSCSSGNASVYTIPGGCMALGLVLAGYDVTPEACLEYYANLQPGTATDRMYREVGAGGLMRLLASDPSLRNRIGELPGGAKNLERFLGATNISG